MGYIVTLVLCVLGATACDSTTDPEPEPERDYVNVEGTFQAVEVNGVRITPTVSEDPCPDLHETLGSLPNATFILAVYDWLDDASEPDSLISVWEDCGTAVSDHPDSSTTRYVATQDSILVHPPRSPHRWLGDAAWTDPEFDSFMMFAVDTSCCSGGRFIYDTAAWNFQRCSDDPNGCDSQ